MNIQIHAVNVGAIDDLEDRVRDDVTHALRGFADRITSVTVHMREVNGHRGSSAKHVTVEAHLAGLPPLAVNSEDPDMGRALAAAMTKLEHAAQHKVGKQDN
ncbi:MAG: HPF/RaiA family ribosome-associated protein [Clostridia bacterium]|nr:HPF/RaiA family ribosome-associated protein [Deltaproteobacteria bacterium]